MKIFKVAVSAGGSEQITLAGRYFRALNADDRFTVEFLSSSDNVRTEFLAGLGMSVEGGFTAIRIESDIEQIVQFIAGNTHVDDSRLAGEVDLNGALQMLQSGATQNNYGSVNVGTGATLIAAANVDRRSIVVQNVGVENVYIGSDNAVTSATGIVVASGGVYSAENINDVYAVTASATSEIRFSEDIN